MCNFGVAVSVGLFTNCSNFLAALYNFVLVVFWETDPDAEDCLINRGPIALNAVSLSNCKSSESLVRRCLLSGHNPLSAKESAFDP